MTHHSALAEVKFPQFAVNLYGRVEQMSPTRVCVRLETLPDGAHVLREGTEAQLMVVARGVVYRAAVRVSENHAPRLTMQFSSPPQAAQRRRASRRSCDFSVSFRALHGDCAGAWQSGQATDINGGGMRMRLDRRMELPGEVELMFHLHGGPAEARGGEERGEETAPAFSARPIKATARVAHRASAGDDGMVVGLTFRKLASCDELRLLRYADSELVSQML